MKTHSWSRLAEAFDYAAMRHQDQKRKGTDIPYISHLMSVSALILEQGGSDAQAIAGLLHDVIEDAELPQLIPEIRTDILEKFGPIVLSLVEGCTDGEIDSDGKKPEWKHRKQNYLSKLKKKNKDLLLVSCCDKLHNARSILTDLLSVGESVFDRFTAGKSETLWYYKSLSDIFSERLKGEKGEVAARELAFTVSEIERISSAAKSSVEAENKSPKKR